MKNVIAFPSKLHVIPDCSDVRFENEQVFNSLEEFMDRDKPKKVDAIETIEQITYMKEKIKFYLDEIKLFTR